MVPPPSSLQRDACPIMHQDQFSFVKTLCWLLVASICRLDVLIDKGLAVLLGQSKSVVLFEPSSELHPLIRKECRLI
jgi:hypothetical protein